MELEVRTLQISKSSWVQAVSKNYEDKISFFCPLGLKMQKSEKDFLKNIDSKDFVVICDEHGKSFTSRKFAGQLEKIMESGKRKCFVFIGGPFGLPDDVKKRADLSISLSHFVFNQEVALVVALEQIFRAFTILHNHPYHNE